MATLGAFVTASFHNAVIVIFPDGLEHSNLLHLHLAGKWALLRSSLHIREPRFRECINTQSESHVSGFMVSVPGLQGLKASGQRPELEARLIL